MARALTRADLLRGRFTKTGDAPPPAGPRIAAFTETCLARRGTACRACEEPCPTGAIRFRLQLGGRAEPDVRAGLCDGCGACLPLCPTGSIALIDAVPGAEVGS